MMNPLRLSTVTISTMPAPVLRSAIFAAGVVGLLATSGLEGLQTNGAAPRADISAPFYTTTQERDGTPQSGSMSNDDPGQTDLRTDVAMAEPSLAGAAADASIANISIVNAPEPVAETAPSNAPPAEHAPPNEPAPAQVATANPQDGASGFDDLGAILREADKSARSFELVDRCTAQDSCVDQYLWTLYQRTPKEDSIKTVEWRDVTIERKIKVKGKTKSKTVTVAKAFTKLVDQDFGWKDPKAAERARMPMMDYVIGGMDRSFKLKLFHMLRAAEAAGLSPGITSAFRDDYRQSIASGLKAASNKSYHGGSSRGGYGYGLAADIVSVQGGTRNERWASSDRLWKWVDAHGKEFGIGRPYLGRDPPHVAPVDGEEYAKHNRGVRLAASNTKNASTKQAASNGKNAGIKQAASNGKNAKRVAMRDSSRAAKRAVTRDVPRPAKRPRTAAASKMRAS
jgi:hypothetical protein